METIELEVEIPVSADCIAGHFPHRPLVPGALLNAALATAMEARLGAVLVELAKLRFSAPVTPGERLLLRAELRPESRWRLRGLADGREVLRGLFGFAAMSAASGDDHPLQPLMVPDADAKRVAGSDMAALYAALPHAGRMRLLENVLHWDAASLVASTGSHRRGDHPLRLAGRLHGLAALEYAAQCCALHGVLLERLADSAATTVVATVQHLQLQGGDLDDSGPVLQAAVRCVLRQSQSAAYECTVTDGLGWRLTATLGLMLVPD